MCRADGCERRAAATVRRDDLPGAIRLCATHTEDFRMNGERWTIRWDPITGEVASVIVAPPAGVGRGASGAVGGGVPATPSSKKLAGRLRSVLGRPG